MLLLCFYGAVRRGVNRFLATKAKCIGKCHDRDVSRVSAYCMYARDLCVLHLLDASHSYVPVGAFFSRKAPWHIHVPSCVHSKRTDGFVIQHSGDRQAANQHSPLSSAHTHITHIDTHAQRNEPLRHAASRAYASQRRQPLLPARAPSIHAHPRARSDSQRIGVLLGGY